MSPGSRRARACSGLTSRLILSYIERNHGHEGVTRLLDYAELSGREQELRDESSWFAFETKVALFDAAEHITGDPRVADKIGRSALELNVANALKRGLRALGSPEFVFRNIVRANAKFNWAHTLELLELGNQRARLLYCDVSDCGYTRHDCDYTGGLLSTVPQLFGLPPAHVVHSRCGVRGDPGCEYEISWQEGAQRIRRAGYGVAFAAGALTIAGALTGPVLLGVAAGTAVIGGGVVGGLGVRYVSRRMRSLDAQVVEQEAAMSQLFESLGDLSSDLRLDEVLDKITAKAQTAVGGHEFALLLSDGTALHVEHHSGIPERSLRALERWAESEQETLRRGPLLVDDVALVPELAELGDDPELALGSMCAAALVFQERYFGVLVALAHGAFVFLPHDTAALNAYAAQAAIALSNARMVANLQRQVDEDPLTGLANTRAFGRACGAAFAEATPSGEPVSIVALDLDHFKAINDRFGHPYGDDVLRRVAEALRGVVRPDDTVARLGGEEFALLLPRAGAAAAWAVAERARAAVSDVRVNDQRLSISAGIATYPEAAQRDLMRFADRALYHAKEMGRGRSIAWSQADPLDKPPAAKRPELFALLEQPGALETVFQPIVDLTSARIVGYEALTRFPTLAGRDVSEIFGEAHQVGIGERLEALALKTALAVPGCPVSRVTINLSVAALCSEAIWEALPEDLSNLCIEMTEHESFADDSAVAGAIRKLRQRGALIALDDAGAGYSGLSQLLRIRPDIVKLDRELIRGVAYDRARAALVASFVDFTTQVGCVVCAEGVEERSDLQALVNLDVSYAQGYLLGRPAPPWPTVEPSVTDEFAMPVRAGLRIVGTAARAGGGAGAVAADLERLRTVAAASLGADEVEIWRWDTAGDRLLRVAPVGNGDADGSGGAGGSGDVVVRALTETPARRQVVVECEVGQVLHSDPQADATERAELGRRGRRSLLLMPLAHDEQTTGLLACYATFGRPWGRGVVARARATTEAISQALAGSP